MAHGHSALDWHGRTVLDRDGDKIGSVQEIYLDERTGEPEWLLVKTGLFGSSSSFVPLQGAEPTGDDVRVPFEKSQVKDAPHVDPDHELSQDEEARIYAHYGIEYGEARSDSGLPEGTAGTTGTHSPPPRGAGTAGPAPPPART